MSFLRLPLQAFFQPNELDRILNERPAVRRRYLWLSAGFAVLWSAVWYAFVFSFYDSLSVSRSERGVVPLAMSSSI